MTRHTVRFTRVRDGRYIQPESGIELVRGVDDSDGYDRTEWHIWTAQMGECIGTRPSLNAAKARARQLIERGTR